ncbi:hypothetical protein LWI28_027220 [Acer negundo]|uniref:mitogen-activated protein kinase kinase kinase n=1 Tax=Acer negundo TaxID=4023 RepID=A0AAD5IWB5_ACENE|nr:hypothetical protein LWI28_027220 [Acer negundo]KAK4846109.1 hypothetical protein QYF36_013188 [Acer negundo]
MDWTRGHTIGHGSSATVSLATSLLSGKVFAAKSAELSESEFLQREQKILSSLNSPHIITYKGCDITSENNKLMYNLLMEYAAGGTLTNVIRRHGSGGRLDEPTIANYTRQILQGLEYVHSNGLVHCDIKGRNILITESGAKIADFGCAKWQSEEVSSQSGTPMFMAPEVARGEHQGFASDIWAVGCTVIEMASGGPPWSDATDPVTVLYRIAYSGELPELPGCLSKQAKDFLSKCLRRNPKERWTTTRLLGHSFLEQFNSCTTKPIQESNSSTSNSPTSILDQDKIWNSLVDETQTTSLGNLIPSRSLNRVTDERIRRLSSFSDEQQGPSWSRDDEISWITVRENNNNMIITTIMDDEIEGKDDMICGPVLLDSISGGLEKQKSDYNSEKFLDCLNSNVISSNNSRISGGINSCGLCTYSKNIVVIRDRLFSPPLISNLSIS